MNGEFAETYDKDLTQRKIRDGCRAGRAAMVKFHCHHYHVTLPAQISLTLSRHPSLSSISPGRSSRLYLVSAQVVGLYLVGPLNGIQCLLRADEYFYWSSNNAVSMCRFTYEFVLKSSAVNSIYCSSYLDDLGDRGKRLCYCFFVVVSHRGFI